jgi:uncharacterized protein YjbJ (UPF0337 family)
MNATGLAARRLLRDCVFRDANFGTLPIASRFLWQAHFGATERTIAMNKDQIKGAAKDMAGKAEKTFGDAVKSPEHQIKGAAKQVAGKTQKAMGDMKEDAGKADRRAEKDMKREERRSH